MSDTGPTPKQLRAAREDFRRLLNASAPEPAWQKFFSENPYVLTQALPLKIAPHEIVPLGRPGRSEPDFVFYPREPRGHPSYGVIELKRPDTNILIAPRREIITLSRDAATAIAQAQLYATQLRRALKELYGTHFFFGNPSQLFLIMGVSTDLATIVQREIEESLLDGLLPKDSRLIPYDTLLGMFEESVPPAIIALSVQTRHPTDTAAIQAVFAAMPSRFKPENAKGITAVIQYDITGDAGGQWHATIANGACTLAAGPAPRPNLMLRISAQDWLDLLAGRQSGQRLFMSGALRITGEMGVAMKLGSWFSL